jgi:hypothetical protein
MIFEVSTPAARYTIAVDSRAKKAEVQAGAGP